MKKKILALAAALALLLSAGCSFVKEQKPANVEQTVVESHAKEKEEFLQRAAEIEKYQADVEANAMTQAEMNTSSYEVCEKWEGLYGDVNAFLKDTLTDSELKSIEEDEKAWEEEKQKAIDAVDEEVGRGTMYPMVYNTTVSELTKERCYKLIDMIK